MNAITAVVLTKNEEASIGGCLDSLKWCDHVLVLDSFSTDRTVEIAQQHGAQVVQRRFVNFADQRNAAIDLVNSDWIFFVDADEQVTPELAEEVKLAINEPAIDGWWIPRRNYYFGKWLLHGGFYPDYHLRLAKTTKYRYDPRQIVHELPEVDGNMGYLINPLLHYWYQDFDELLSTRAMYARYMAEMHYRRGVRPSYQLLAGPIYVFCKQLIYLKSYKDGTPGWLISLVWGYYKFVEYWKVWEMRMATAKNNTPVNSTPSP